MRDVRINTAQINLEPDRTQLGNGLFFFFFFGISRGRYRAGIYVQ